MAGTGGIHVPFMNAATPCWVGDAAAISAATLGASAEDQQKMGRERTFSIIKPDATARNLTGAVNAMIEQSGLRIIAQKRVRITREQAATFYAVHRARPFFGEVVEFMT